MSWRDEEIPLINEEERLKKYIKNELINYYLYLYKWKLLDIEKKSLRCSTGGSIIQMPDGVSDGKSPQQRISDKSCELEELQEVFEQKMDNIDKWISVLEERYHEVTKEYIMKNCCKNAKEVGWKLSLEEDTVKKYAERALSRISSRNNKIL